MAGSVFGSVETPRRSSGARRWATRPRRQAGVFDGVALTAEGWAIAPLHLDEVRSSFFDSPDRFPSGMAVPDSAFLMGGLETCWRPQPALVATQERFHVRSYARQLLLP